MDRVNAEDSAEKSADWRVVDVNGDTDLLDRTPYGAYLGIGVVPENKKIL